jgi:hypothetical protein
MTVSDTSRAVQHDPDQSYPDQVKIQLMWMIDGHPRVRTTYISADQFFGMGTFGAPIEGAALLQQIEIMRRAGPPPVEQKGKKNGVHKARR